MGREVPTWVAVVVIVVVLIVIVGIYLALTRPKGMEGKPPVGKNPELMKKMMGQPTPAQPIQPPR
ncbi:MAG: hypothetical protein NZ937_07960 [Armatimonadetes bacterium]|nr:hypothetical protein [Armatimonadota bacterium]